MGQVDAALDELERELDEMSTGDYAMSYAKYLAKLVNDFQTATGIPVPVSPAPGFTHSREAPPLAETDLHTHPRVPQVSASED